MSLTFSQIALYTDYQQRLDGSRPADTMSRGWANGSGLIGTNQWFLDCQGYRGIFIGVNVTAVSGTNEIQLDGLFWSGTSNGFVDMPIGVVPIAGTGDYPIRIHPGLTPIPNAVFNDLLPSILLFSVVTTGSISFSSGLHMVR